MIEETLVAALETVFPGAVYPDEAPFQAPLPLCIWQQVGGRALEYVDQSEPTDRWPRIQLVVWAERRLHVRDLMRQAQDALRTAAGITAVPLADYVALSEPDLGRRGARQDFSVFGPR